MHDCSSGGSGRGLRLGGSNFCGFSSTVAMIATPAAAMMIPNTNDVQITGFASSYVAAGIHSPRTSICGLFGFGVVQPYPRMPVVALTTTPVAASPTPMVFPTDPQPVVLNNVSITTTDINRELRRNPHHRRNSVQQSFITHTPSCQCPRQCNALPS